MVCYIRTTESKPLGSIICMVMLSKISIFMAFYMLFRMLETTYQYKFERNSCKKTLNEDEKKKKGSLMSVDVDPITLIIILIKQIIRNNNNNNTS